MRGRLSDDGSEAILPLTVIGSSGVRVEVEAAVDTGFTGSLCLPLDIVRSLSVPFVGWGASPCSPTGAPWRPATTERAYSGTGASARIQVLVTDGGPLVGMTLLRGSVLTYLPLRCRPAVRLR